MVEAPLCQRPVPLLPEAHAAQRIDHGSYRSHRQRWQKHQGQYRGGLQAVQQSKKTPASHGMGRLSEADEWLVQDIRGENHECRT